MSVNFILKIIISYVLIGICQSFIGNLQFKKDIETITTSMIGKLEIHHVIVVENEGENGGEIKDLKMFFVDFIPVVYFTHEKLFNYLVQGGLNINVKTMIVFHDENISNFGNLLHRLQKLEILYRVSRFTWLIFVKKLELREYYEELLIPYNCEAIIIHPLNEFRYEMIEVYKIKNGTMILDYGTWDRNLGLAVTEVPLVRRRMNFHDEKLILNSYLEENFCNSRRVCVHVEFIRDFSQALNFRFDWVHTPGSNIRGIIQHEVTPKNSDFLQVIYPFEPDFNVFKCDIVGPVFKSDINWHIKEPSASKNPEYYMEPLAPDVWIAIIVLIIIGTAVILIQRISRKRFLNEEEKLQFSNVDGAFMPLEIFCNQEGNENIPFKTIGFALGFTSVFVWAIYGATITSYLMIQIPKIPFTNLEGFVQNGHYLMGFNVKAGKLPQILLEFSRVPVIKLVNEKFIKKSKPSRKVNEICDEKLALMSIDYDIFKNKINCKVHTIKNPILLSFTIIPLMKNSSFTHVFNYILMNFYTSGLIQRVKAHDFAMTYKPDEEEEFYPVELDQMVQVLSIVPIGLFLALIALIAEFIFKGHLTISGKKLTGI